MKGRYPASTDAEQRLVLDAIQSGMRTWDEIQAATRLTDNRLGVVLGDLFAQRKLRTAEQDEIRVYKLVSSRNYP
jgi:hypothetical protein